MPTLNLLVHFVLIPTFTVNDKIRTKVVVAFLQVPLILFIFSLHAEGEQRSVLFFIE